MSNRSILGYSNILRNGVILQSAVYCAVGEGSGRAWPLVRALVHVHGIMIMPYGLCVSLEGSGRFWELI